MLYTVPDNSKPQTMACSHSQPKTLLIDIPDTWLIDTAVSCFPQRKREKHSQLFRRILDKSCICKA